MVHLPLNDLSGYYTSVWVKPLRSGVREGKGDRTGDGGVRGAGR